MYIYIQTFIQNQYPISKHVYIQVNEKSFDLRGNIDRESRMDGCMLPFLTLTNDVTTPTRSGTYVNVRPIKAQRSAR